MEEIIQKVTFRSKNIRYHLTMKIKVKYPSTSEILELEANPTENDNESGWTIILPSGNFIFIVLEGKQWKIREGDTIEPEFLSAIGKAINPWSGKKEQTWEVPKDPEKASDERDVEKLVRQKKEAEIRKKNLENGDKPRH